MELLLVCSVSGQREEVEEVLEGLPGYRQWQDQLLLHSQRERQLELLQVPLRGETPAHHQVIEGDLEPVQKVISDQEDNSVPQPPISEEGSARPRNGPKNWYRIVLLCLSSKYLSKFTL